MFLAIRELKHSKTRYLLISLIMILIAWLVLFVSGLAKGLSSDNASSIQNMNADYLVVDQNSDHRLNRSVMTDDLLAEIRSAADKSGDEIEAAPLGVQMSSVTQAGSPRKIDATFFAIEAEGLLAPKLAEGRMIDDTAVDEAVADRSFKAEEGLKLGDVIEDQASGRQFTIVGFTEGQSFSHAPVIHVNFAAWKTIAGGPRAAGEEVKDEDGNVGNVAFNAIALKASDTAAERIGTEMSGVEVISKSEALKGIPGYKEEQGSLLMMIAFLFIIAAFVLAVFFYVITIQKMNQFGVLKAIGAKTGFLVRSMLAQVLSLSIFSLAVGIALTYGVAFMLPDSMPFELNFKLVGGSSLLFLAVAVAGSLLSLYRVAKVDAIEAIGRAA